MEAYLELLHSEWKPWPGEHDLILRVREHPRISKKHSCSESGFPEFSLGVSSLLRRRELFAREATIDQETRIQKTGSV